MPFKFITPPVPRALVIFRQKRAELRVIWIAGNVSVCHSVHPPVEATVPVRRFCSAPGRLESS
jgi:hypothetical protein